MTPKWPFETLSKQGTPPDQQQVGESCHKQVENGKQCGPASYLAGKDWIIQRQRYRGLRPGRRPHMCHHEAGHCVALWHFGYTFHRVSVLTVAEVRQGVQLMNEYDEPLAGTEGCVVGHDLGFGLGSGSDPELLEALGMPPETVAEARRALQAAVEMNSVCIYAGMVAEARYRKCGRGWVLFTTGAADRASAKDLGERWLSDPRAREQAMMSGELMAAALIRSEVSWQAITTVAQALMDRGELSGDEVDALCATVYGRERPSQKAWQDSWPSDPKVIRAGWVP